MLEMWSNLYYWFFLIITVGFVIVAWALRP